MAEQQQTASKKRKIENTKDDTNSGDLVVTTVEESKKLNDRNDLINRAQQATVQRFVLFPIKYQTLWDMYQLQRSSFWIPSEIDMNDDVQQWKTKLTEQERQFIENVLGFFAASDGIVGENIVLQLYSRIVIPEARACLGFQLAMEGIHAETYSLMLDTLVRDKQRQTHLFGAIQTIPCIKNKAEWAMKWIHDNQEPLWVNLVAFAFVEGLHFQASFCALFWLRKRGLMPGLTYSNQLISRDEGFHFETSCLLVQMVRQGISLEEEDDETSEQKKQPVAIDDDKIRQILSQAVDIEKQYVVDSLRVDLIGMNKTLMLQYVEYVADVCALMLGLPEKIYNTPLPFDWMELASLTGKTNFFEKRVAEYQKTGAISNRQQLDPKQDFLSEFM